MNTTLANYVLASNNDYVTNNSLNTTLNGYVTKSALTDLEKRVKALEDAQTAS